MAAFSPLSMQRLLTCRPELVRLFERVSELFPCIVLQGVRTRAEQLKLLAEGKSQTLNSKHLADRDGLSRAVDAAPQPYDDLDRERLTLFAGFVLGVAAEMGISLRWGGDWDRDTEVQDNKFDDLFHFELYEGD